MHLTSPISRNPAWGLLFAQVCTTSFQKYHLYLESIPLTGVSTNLVWCLYKCEHKVISLLQQSYKYVDLAPEIHAPSNSWLVTNRNIVLTILWWQKWNTPPGMALLITIYLKLNKNICFGPEQRNLAPIRYSKCKPHWLQKYSSTSTVSKVTFLKKEPHKLQPRQPAKNSCIDPQMILPVYSNTDNCLHMRNPRTHFQSIYRNSMWESHLQYKSQITKHREQKVSRYASPT